MEFQTHVTTRYFLVQTSKSVASFIKMVLQSLFKQDSSCLSPGEQAPDQQTQKVEFVGTITQRKKGYLPNSKYGSSRCVVQRFHNPPSIPASQSPIFNEILINEGTDCRLHPAFYNHSHVKQEDGWDTAVQKYLISGTWGICRPSLCGICVDNVSQKITHGTASN